MKNMLCICVLLFSLSCEKENSGIQFEDLNESNQLIVGNWCLESHGNITFSGGSNSEIIPHTLMISPALIYQASCNNEIFETGKLQITSQTDASIDIRVLTSRPPSQLFRFSTYQISLDSDTLCIHTINMYDIGEYFRYARIR